MTDQEAIESLKCYRAQSGTSYPEEIEKAIKALEEIQQYREVGKPDECRVAVEKQMVKKPIEPDEEYGTFKCPSCGGLIFAEDRFETHKYCLLCGQKLDWSDEEC